MHVASMELMAKFAEDYADKKSLVLDIGSFDVNGTYKELFSDCKSYMGLDITEGPNVDLAVDDPYQWPLKDGYFDIVISGQTFEHIEKPTETIKEMARVLKPGGHCCIIAPSAGPVHHYPIFTGHWSVSKFRKLAKAAKLTVIKAEVHKAEPWDDVILIVKK